MNKPDDKYTLWYSSIYVAKKRKSYSPQIQKIFSVSLEEKQWKKNIKKFKM